MLDQVEVTEIPDLHSPTTTEIKPEQLQILDQIRPTVVRLYRGAEIYAQGRDFDLSFFYADLGEAIEASRTGGIAVHKLIDTYGFQSEDVTSLITRLNRKDDPLADRLSEALILLGRATRQAPIETESPLDKIPWELFNQCAARLFRDAFVDTDPSHQGNPFRIIDFELAKASHLLFNLLTIPNEFPDLKAVQWQTTSAVRDVRENDAQHKYNLADAARAQAVIAGAFASRGYQVLFPPPPESNDDIHTTHSWESGMVDMVAYSPQKVLCLADAKSSISNNARESQFRTVTIDPNDARFQEIISQATGILGIKDRINFAHFIITVPTDWYTNGNNLVAIKSQYLQLLWDTIGRKMEHYGWQS